MAKSKKKSNRRLYYALGALVLVVGALAVAKSQGLIGDSNLEEVEIAASETRNIYAKVTESGVIEPAINVPVAPDVSGEVVSLFVKEGMSVTKGDLLLTIRPDDYQAVVEQAAATLNQVKASQMQAKASMSQAEANLLQDSINYERNKQLFAEKVISQNDYETARLQYNISKSQLRSAQHSVQAAYFQVKNANASLKQARQNLDRTNIYASMDGTITELNVEIGQRVVGTSQMAGTEILKIADLSNMEVVVEVNENDIVNVRLGDSSRVEVDAFPDETFYGRVTEIAYSAAQDYHGTSDQVTNFEVKVQISPDSYNKNTGMKDIPVTTESPFRPGMTALIDIFTKEAKGIVAVPIKAVTLSKTLKKDSTGVDQTGQEIVFILDGNKVKEIPVDIGISDDEFIEIKDGIPADAKVVTGPYTVLTKKLEDGSEVKIKEEKDKDGAKKS
ncbi:MAG: efflux RND transporter periplasmic adaptor subunit [Bacteroidota bacterium]